MKPFHFLTFFTRSSFPDGSDALPSGILNEKDHLRKRIYGIRRNSLDTQNPSSYIAIAKKKALFGHFIKAVRSKNSGPLYSEDIYRRPKAVLEGTTLHLERAARRFCEEGPFPYGG